MSVFFVKLGQDVHIEGGLLTDAIDDGVRKGYKEHGYRASVLDPITRANTKDNTPAIVHISLVLGDSLEITFCRRDSEARICQGFSCSNRRTALKA